MHRWAVVTGASSGIGYELATQCARGGYDILAVGTHKERLQELKQELHRRYKTSVIICIADLSKQSSATKVHEATQKLSGKIEVLINCAGFGDLHEFTQADITKLHGMMQVNMYSLTMLSRLIGADMVAAGSGKILNVSSVASFMPGPLMSVYHASKSYVLSLSYALRSELKPHGVHVAVLCPGVTASRFQKQANQDSLRLFKNPRKMAQPADVAHAGYAGLMDGQFMILPGFTPKALFILGKITPHSWLAASFFRAYKS